MSTFPSPRPRAWPVALLAFAAFAAGVLADRSGLLPGRYGQEPPGLAKTFAPFWQAWHLVKRHYVDPESAQDVPMTRGALAGMLASLGDVGHTTYLSPEDVKRMAESLKGQLEGIGVRLTVRKRQPTILQVLPDSPALRAGLKAGDVLLEVDGKSVAGLSLEQIANLVRGPAGGEVKLRVLSVGQQEPHEVTVTRGKVNVPEVVWALLPGAPVAHVALQEFGKNADAELRKALQESRAKGARALILDVRGNPGGLKDQAVAVTSEFLRDGQVVFIEEDAQGRRTEVLAKDGGRAVDIPLCVLIDEGTASSAEIFAGALEDHGRARLVGTKTFGTGTVLTPYPLNDGSAILLATAKWLTPNGNVIWHKGIAPDVEVTLPEGAEALMPWSEEGLTEEAFRKSKDRQLQKAFDLLWERPRNQDKKAG